MSSDLPPPETPQDAAHLADDFPSPSSHNQPIPDISTELAAQALSASLSSFQPPPPSPSPPPGHASPDFTQPALDQSMSHTGTLSPSRQPPSSAEQIAILRASYARNPNPSKRELERLAAQTGRPWNKIREYFRQRRSKLRGLDELEGMDEPGRATGWLQVAYRAAPPTTSTSQLALYNAYKTRFDPYSAHTPLLGGQELIQLACATFPGCEMAKEDDYVLKGLGKKEEDGEDELQEGRQGGLENLQQAEDGEEPFDAEQGGAGSDPITANGGAPDLEHRASERSLSGQMDGADESWERGLEGMVEPLRAGTWLLSSYQQPPSPSAPTANIPQTELYSSYASRFSALMPPSASPAPVAETHPPGDEDGEDDRVNRLLNPIELINLARMTFPSCEPAVDEDGRFVIRGLERRDGVERGWKGVSEGMFPFALMSEPRAEDPDHPLTSMLKRKISALHAEGEDGPDVKRTRYGEAGEPLGDEEKELLEGLRRFKGSRFGAAVRDVCVQQ